MIAQQLTLGLTRGSSWDKRIVTVVPLSLAAHMAAATLLAMTPLLLSPELPPIAGTPCPGSPAVVPLRKAPRVDLTKLSQRGVRRRHVGGLSSPHQPPTSMPAMLPSNDVLDGASGDGPFVPGLLLCEEDCDDGPAKDSLLPDPFPTPTPKPQYIRVSSFSPPRKIANVPPVYPELARKARIQGTVTVECTIAPTGRVENATATDGPPLLREAAVEAVQQWRYTPTLMGGVEVGVFLTVHVNFRIQ